MADVGELSHFDAGGQAHMVDVGDKAETRRVAVASERVVMRPETLQHIEQGSAAKGDVLGVARIAAIQGAKRTAELIPRNYAGRWQTRAAIGPTKKNGRRSARSVLTVPGYGRQFEGRYLATTVPSLQLQSMLPATAPASGAPPMVGVKMSVSAPRSCGMPVAVVS